MVYHAGSRRVVSLADGLDADSLTLGDEVFLNNEMTFVLGKAPSGICAWVRRRSSTATRPTAG